MSDPRLADGTYDFGFRWGPATVTRLAHIQGRGYALRIGDLSNSVEVWVSEKGRSIRVFRDGKELK